MATQGPYDETQSQRKSRMNAVAPLGSEIPAEVSPKTMSKAAKWSLNVAAVGAAAVVLAVLIWQAITAHGAPDPTADGISPAAVIMNTGILVFREGLEAVLILAALTASFVRTKGGYWKPVALGAGVSFAASVATWFIVVAIISSINAPALHLQAATGLIAIVVLLIIMNWFFHKVYWTGWIQHHNRRKRSLTEATGRNRSTVFRGLVLLGFTAVYREGFEIVLFLQSMRLRAGSQVVLIGVTIGLALTLLVALLTFVAHQKLPFKKMLVLTGVMLGGVLLVMVGEQVQEMQQAGWLPQHDLSLPIPDWMGTWFAFFPNVEGIAAQLLAGAFVIGSYYLARRVCARESNTAAEPLGATCIVPDCAGCHLAHPGREHDTAAGRTGASQFIGSFRAD